jgi:hypothetical protein
LWGGHFFLRPLSLILMGLIALTLGYAIYKSRATRRARPAGVAHAG